MQCCVSELWLGVWVGEYFSVVEQSTQIVYFCHFTQCPETFFLFLLYTVDFYLFSLIIHRERERERGREGERERRRERERERERESVPVYELVKVVCV